MLSKNKELSKITNCNKKVFSNITYIAVVSLLTNVFVCKQFGLQTEVSGKILFLTSGDKHNHSHLSHRNTNTDIYFRIVEQLKFVNHGTTVLKILQSNTA